MKRQNLSIIVITFFMLFSLGITQQTTAQLFGKSGSSGLSNNEIVSGLKDALKLGADSATAQLSSIDGFFANASIKILMPPEAKKMESTLRRMGMGRLVDNTILSMNRAAEDAAKSAAPIIWDAIKGMSVTDALGILRGGDFAATDYLKAQTTNSLTIAFSPVVEDALKDVNATKYWKDMFTTYNRFSKSPVDTDLTSYVTGKALDGIFYEIGLEEQKIRQDPAARATDVLKKVFGQ